MGRRLCIAIGLIATMCFAAFPSPRTYVPVPLTYAGQLRAGRPAMAMPVSVNGRYNTLRTPSVARPGQSVQDRVVEMVGENLFVDVTPSTTWDEVGANGVDLAEIVWDLENEYDLDLLNGFPYENGRPRWATVGELASHVEQVQASRETPK